MGAQKAGATWVRDAIVRTLVRVSRVKQGLIEGMAKKPMAPKKLTVAERIEATGGMDEVARLIADGVPLTEIAKRAGVTDGGLLTWIEADAERSACARAVRQSTARMWDERAADVIGQAADPFELSKAKELAHHYRWRASKIAPRDYGDRIQADVGGGVTLTIKSEFDGDPG